MVEQYGSQMALKAVANISAPDASTLKIEPWDKNVMAEIDKGIMASGIGLNPQNMGTYFLITIPPMTEERRKILNKTVHKEAEEARIAIRNIRHDYLKKIKAQKEEGEMSEDEQKQQEKKVQEVLDTANKTVEDAMKAKEKEILSV